MFHRGITVLRIRGIPVRLHLSLLLILPFLVLSAARQFAMFARMLDIEPEAFRFSPLAWGFALAIGLFVSVLLHELAHTAVALRAGARIRSITLMMLGGVTLMEKEVRPEREAWMAFAGPLASYAIAAVSFAGYRLFATEEAMAHFADLPAGLLAFASMNAVLGTFNLLPAFPMDGGRVLRGLLARPLGHARATHVAVWTGRAMAVIFALWGLFTYNAILLLIAFFVYSGGRAEEERETARDLLRGVSIAEIMTDRLGEAEPDESIADVARRLFDRDLVGARVVDDTTIPSPHHTLGVVTLADLAARARQGETEVPVREAMRTDLPRLHPDDEAAAMLDVPPGAGGAVALVVDAGDEVLGIVTPETIQRVAELGPLFRRPRQG